MRVAVLGCGPAGLMAAHAVMMAGHEPVIYSRKRKSEMYGCQYLHEPIPDMTDSTNYVDVEYQLRGTESQYRRKVYGKTWDGTVSPEDLDEQHLAWDIRETYDRLWDAYESDIMDYHIDPAAVRFVMDQPGNDLVINSIPLPELCHKGHTFRSQQVIAAGDAPGRGIDVGRIYSIPANTVICNGEEMPTWYRASNIFDHTTVEWPNGIKPPLSSASEVLKPTDHNCDCWPDVFKVGRYGSWTKGVLSHSAFFRTMERMIDGPPAKEASDNDPILPALY